MFETLRTRGELAFLGVGVGSDGLVINKNPQGEVYVPFAIYQHDVGHMSGCLESWLAHEHGPQMVSCCDASRTLNSPRTVSVQHVGLKETSGQLGSGTRYFQCKIHGHGEYEGTYRATSANVSFDKCWDCRLQGWSVHYCCCKGRRQNVMDL